MENAESPHIKLSEPLGALALTAIASPSCTRPIEKHIRSDTLGNQTRKLGGRIMIGMLFYTMLLLPFI